MRPGRILSSVLVLAMTAVPCVAKLRRHHTSTKTTKAAAKHTSGQRSIDDNRATEIQQALVHSGYMTEVTGHWDSTTEAAMQKYQSDNGWQTKLIPDSRAIIKLGLGPNQTASQTNSNLSAETVAPASQTVAESYADANDLSQR